jgi:hypothetical protein
VGYLQKLSKFRRVSEVSPPKKEKKKEKKKKKKEANLNTFF